MLIGPLPPPVARDALTPLLPALTRIAEAAAAHPVAGRWLLRGSLLTRALTGPHDRWAADIDWVDPIGVPVPVWEEALPEVLRAAGVEAGPARHTFEGTQSPGLRIPFVWEGVESHAEVSGNDPLTGPAVVCVLPEGTQPVRGVAVEDLLAWKVHGLFEFGRGKWRAKDLYDLLLLLDRAPWSPGALTAALPPAFSSRGLSPDACRDMLDDVWGHSTGSHRKWWALRRRYGVHLDFEAARTAARTLLTPFLEGLLEGLIEGHRADQRPAIGSSAQAGSPSISESAAGDTGNPHAR